MLKYTLTILILTLSVASVQSQSIKVNKNGTGQWDVAGSFDPSGIPSSSDTLIWENNSVSEIFLTGTGPTVDTDTVCDNSGGTYKCGFVGNFTNNKNGGVVDLDYSRIRIVGDYTINNTFTLELDNHAQFVVTGNLTVSNNASFTFGVNCENCKLEIGGSLTGDNGSIINVQGGGEISIGMDVDLGTGSNITIDPDSRMEVENDFTIDGGTVTVEGCTSDCTENGYLSIGGTVDDNGSITGTGTIYAPNDPNFSCPSGANCITEPLPITLIYFNGSISGNAVDLEWKTSTEDNFYYFQLYKLKDDKQTELDKVYSTGNSSGDSYGWTDENPAIGLNFYQLKSVDYDGYEELFPVISVLYEPSDVNLGFYPNPTRGNILRSNIRSSFDLEVYALSGEKLQETSINFPEDYSIDHLKPGLYIFRYNVNGLIKTQKIIVD